MDATRVQRGFFFALLVAITAAFLWLVRGFLQPVFWAVALGIMVFPLHARIERWMGGRASLAALTSVLLVVVIVIFPLAGIATAVTAEATALFARIDTGDLGVEEIYRGLQQRLPWVAGLLERAGVDPERLESQLAAGAVQASRLVASRALSIGQDTLRVTVFFFLMLYLLFFFLRDGPRLLDGLVRALPLGDARERHLLQRFADVSRATIKGTLVVGIAQGTIGGVTFALLGIDGAVLWGVAMTLLSILPAIGPGLVWVPAMIYLFLNGQTIAGIILLLVGVLVIGLVDNLLRPILVGRDTRMPDYLILLATLGGLAAFGLAGIIIGPIIAAFFLSVWQMAQEEFAGDPDEQRLPPAGDAPGSHDLELPAPAAEERHGDERHHGLGDRDRPEHAARTDTETLR